ncbi:hypothetical protein FY534_11200 [Alicyclobacillus sp. TC]|uniref:phosphosulfolactate synthase n=1 Tax=Alicyclobacillus sp. TC TaxID=2606450 RepID=UPI001931216B|nr:phosphosulfolactate synthase [Alicyclobacillus sp. TC]QRF24137.1 hypothetical protein FY534_11200 [Alicyclobacillus sp. TC]
MESLPWNVWYTAQLPKRAEKPRFRGITVAMDTGIPFSFMQASLQNVHPYIDFWKFAYGSPVFTTPTILQNKISLCHEYHIRPLSSGILFEYAALRNESGEFLDALHEAGFDAVEISFRLADAKNSHWVTRIEESKNKNFTVFTELVLPSSPDSVPSYLALIAAHLMAGVDYIQLLAEDHRASAFTFYKEWQPILEEAFGERIHHLVWPVPDAEELSRLPQLALGNLNMHLVRPQQLMIVESARRRLLGECSAKPKEWMLGNEIDVYAPSQRQEGLKTKLNQGLWMPPEKK